MKFILVCLFCWVSNIHSAAQTVRNIFDTTMPVTYLGIDFTLAKFFGETADANEIRDKHFPAINNLVITQPEKYDIAEALRRSDVSNNLDQVSAHNRAIPVQQIKTSFPGDFTRLGLTDISKLVSTYDFPGQTGIGVLFVVEGMSKGEKAANIFVTFISMTDKRVLLTERLTGKAGGFGVRNYWAKPIEEILKQIKKSKYNEWKKKYAA